ncbi:hypothetical protein ACWENR_09815 [Micromonospora sp. NPDC004336]
MATAADLIAVITILAVPSVKGWINSHGIWFMIVSALLLFALLVVLELRTSKESDLKERFEKAESEQERLAAEVNRYRQRLEELSAKPTERDQELYRQLTETLPVDGGPTAFLRLSFSGAMWPESAFEGMRIFLLKWHRGHDFDNAQLEQARKALYDAADRLYSAMSRAGERDVRQPDVFRLYEETPAQEARKIKIDLHDFSQDFVAARDNFDRVARDSKLIVIPRQWPAEGVAEPGGRPVGHSTSDE